MPTINEDLFDASLRHQIGLRRYTDGEVKRILGLLDASDKDLVDQIAKQLAKLGAAEGATSKTLERLEAMLTNIRAARQEAIGALGKTLGADMKDLADLEASTEKGLLEAHVPVNLELAAPTAEGLRAATFARPFQGRVLSDWADSIATADRQRLEQQIRLGVVQGETIDQIVRRVRGSKEANYQDGVIQMTRRNAEAVVRTAVNHTSNAAREEVWSANADIIDSLRWTATLDGRTSPICRARDGQTYPVGKGPRPPAHFNCRSTMVAVIDGIAAIGDRPMVRDTRTRKAREVDFREEAQSAAGDKWKSMSAEERRDAIRAIRNKWAEENIGRVPAETNYDAWLRKQPEHFQDDVLGKAKADLFRQGLKLDQFVDRKGQEYSLDELKARVAGNNLSVKQPGVGLKAKALLQQGHSTDTVLAQLKQEFPDHEPTAASLASYKTELKKAGMLDELTGKTSTVGSVGNLASLLKHFDASLPAGVNKAVAGQWAQVVGDLDGVPGAYAYYEAGKGVKLSAAKMGSISPVQGQQVLAHELGHLLNAGHGVKLPDGVLSAAKDAVAKMTGDAKKLYGYYLASDDELTAELFAQALSASPITSQGLSAKAFNDALGDEIKAAKKALLDAFPDAPAAKVAETAPALAKAEVSPPVKPSPAPPSPAVFPGETPGTFNTVGGLAKALLQQGLPDDQVLQAVFAQFPTAKTTKASLASYKVELKKQGLLPVKGVGPTVSPVPTLDHAAVPPPPKAPASAHAPHPDSFHGQVEKAIKLVEAAEADALKEFTVKQGIEFLLDAGIDNDSVLEAWVHEKKPNAHPQDVTHSVKVYKADWLQKVADVPEFTPPKAPPKAKPGPTSGVAKYLQEALDQFDAVLTEWGPVGATWDQVFDLLVKEHRFEVEAAPLVAKALGEMGFNMTSAKAKSYLQVSKEVLAKTAPTAPKVASAPVVDAGPKPKLADVTLGAVSSQALEEAKLLIQQGSGWAEVDELLAKKFGPGYDSVKGGKDLYELAVWEVKQGKLAKPTYQSTLGKPEKLPAVDFTPARPAATPREGQPFPARFTEAQRLAAVSEYEHGSIDTHGIEALNAKQAKAGREPLTRSEYAAIRGYTGGTYRNLNGRLRAGQYAQNHALAAYTEAAQAGLAKMEPYDFAAGPTRRGVSLDKWATEQLLSTHVVGAIVEDNAFVSTTTKPREDMDFRGNIIMEIRGKTGVYVAPYSKHSREKEVLFPPGTRFKIEAVEKDPLSGYVIRMEEVP